MALQLSVAAQHAKLDAITAIIDGGATAATIEVRTGAPPANCAAADSGTLLATLTMSDPSFEAAGTTTAGEANADAITSDVSADASGTPGHFRIKQGTSGTVVAQGTAAVGSGDLNFDAAIELGGEVSITSLVLESGNQ
jgi:hypothetical protein